MTTSTEPMKNDKGQFTPKNAGKTDDKEPDDKDTQLQVTQGEVLPPIRTSRPGGLRNVRKVRKELATLILGFLT